MACSSAMGRRSSESPALCTLQLTAREIRGIPMPSTISDSDRPATAANSAPVLEPLENAGASTVALMEVARLALASLLANKARALLTMLGVIIGVASVVALLAIGNGASAAITSEVQAIGTNVLTIMPGSPSSSGRGNQSTAQTLTLD